MSPTVGREVVIPHYIGVYKDEEAYDPPVFKIINKFSSSFDVINRIVLEPSFEAIVDAGIYIRLFHLKLRTYLYLKKVCWYSFSRTKNILFSYRY